MVPGTGNAGRHANTPVINRRRIRLPAIPRRRPDRAKFAAHPARFLWRVRSAQGVAGRAGGTGAGAGLPQAATRRTSCPVAPTTPALETTGRRGGDLARRIG